MLWSGVAYLEDCGLAGITNFQRNREPCSVNLIAGEEVDQHLWRKRLGSARPAPARAARAKGQFFDSAAGRIIDTIWSMNGPKRTSSVRTQHAEFQLGDVEHRQDW